MNIHKIIAAKQAAKKFNEAANDLILAINEQRKQYPGYHGNAPKQSGALRRASMELTRCLAEMRSSKKEQL